MRARVIGSSAAALAVAGLLSGASPAGAAIAEGNVDAVSASSTASNRSLTNLALSYDKDAGTVIARGRFLADPSTGVSAGISVRFGSVNGTTCTTPQVRIAAQLAPNGVVSSNLSTDGSDVNYGGTVAFDGNTAVVTVASAALKGLPYDCVYGDVFTITDPPVRIATTDGWGRVTAPADPPPPAQPAPQPPTPAPTPPPPAQPAPTTPVVAPPKAAKLSIGVTGVPDIVQKNRWITAKVKVTNAGTKTAKDVALKALARKGVTIKPSTVRLAAKLKASKSKTAKVRFKLGSGAGDDVTVRLRASGKGKLKAEGTVGLITKDGRPAPIGSAGPLKGRYFWANEYHYDYAWDNHAVYFVDQQWAYYGFNVNGGLPVDCKAPSQKVDEDGKPLEHEGCVPYTYDKATGAVKVGNLTGEWKDGKLKIGENDFSELLIPAPGARFQVELEHRGFRGLCGLITGCSTWYYSLGLSDGGTFVKTRSSLTTVGDGWSSPYVAAGSYPPDQYGTYVVLENGLMQLSFANGTVEKYPFGVQLKDGKPDPAGEGVLLGETNYYVDPTP